jgi:superfamily II DNA/RNA helicase
LKTSTLPNGIGHRITDVINIVAKLQQWVKWEGASQIIVPYHSELPEDMKAKITEEFIRSDSKHRIIVATEAMGMGLNNPDIKRVVNWKQPSGLCALMQRAGRAARSSNLTGEFIWFIEPWCFPEISQDIRLELQSHRSSRKWKKGPEEQVAACNDEVIPSGRGIANGKKPGRNSKRKRQDKTLPGEMLNAINGECIQKEILKFFGQQISINKTRRLDLNDASFTTVLAPEFYRSAFCTKNVSFAVVIQLRR